MIEFVFDGRLYCVSPMRWDEVQRDRISFDLCVGSEYKDEGGLFCLKVRIRSENGGITIEFIRRGFLEWAIPYCEVREIEPGRSWKFNCVGLERILRGAFPDFKPDGIVTVDGEQLCFTFPLSDKKLCWPGKEPTLNDPARSSLPDSTIQ